MSESDAVRYALSLVFSDEEADAWLHKRCRSRLALGKAKTAS